MKKNFILICATFLLLLQLNCNKNSESQLYVIDSIKLGNTMEDFEIQMAKKITFSKKPGRSLNKLFFVTEQYLYQNHIQDYMTGSYFTITFNESDNNDLTDYGLIIPTSSSTKDNLIGIHVIFGRTTNSVDLSTLGSITNNNGDPIPYFVQSNRPEYIQKIENLLIKKYGKPTKITSNESVPIFAFRGNALNGYMTEKNNTGNLFEWDNEVVKITFFEGINNYNYTYNPINDSYFSAMDEDRNKTKKLDKDYGITKGFSYLSYELKDDYIKDKKLDNPNL